MGLLPACFGVIVLPPNLRTHTVLFPEMARWLPPEEGEQLLLDFEAEIERLRNAA